MRELQICNVYYNVFVWIQELQRCYVYDIVIEHGFTQIERINTDFKYYVCRV